MTESTNPCSVFFEKDGDEIVIWTNHKRWTVKERKKSEEEWDRTFNKNRGPMETVLEENNE